MGMSTKVLLCIHPSIGVLIQLRLTGIDRCQTWVVSYYLFLMAEISRLDLVHSIREVVQMIIMLYAHD